MSQQNYQEILAFIAVAKEKSFTRAAAKLGVSQSALSHTVKSLEGKLGIRLLTRTTRSVAATAAGEQLLERVAPKFTEIEQEIEALTALREKPAGTVRITCGDHAAETVLWPRLKPLLKEYPDINIELNVDYGLTNIVSEGFDAGVRYGEQLEKDMIAMRIGPDARMAVAGSPEYFANHPVPKHPRDLVNHNCINIRLPTYGGLYAWEFDNGESELNVHVSGQTTFNAVQLIREAAVDGLGLAFLPDDVFASHFEDGTLVRVLEDWCVPFSGYHLYYPNRSNHSPAFMLVLEALRYRRD